MMVQGVLSRISGPVVQATGMRGSQINELVKVGGMQLLGEIIALKGERASIQVYEDTSGLRPGEKVEGTGAPLSVELGPGLLSGVFDGIQRPLAAIRGESGDFIARGVQVQSLDRKARWQFNPSVKNGSHAETGDVLGTVQEFSIEHRIMAPAGAKGKVEGIQSGKFTVTQTICTIGGKEVTLMQKWPVRTPRPVKEKKHFEPPLVTGKRIMDTFFPLAKGGAAAIPGPFGSGKCVSGETPVLLQDGSTPTMRELYQFASANGTSKKTFFEEIIDLNKPVELYSVNHGKILPTSSEQFYKGKSDQLLRIKTRAGKTVDVTPIHKLFHFEGSGAIVEREAWRLKVGDFIIAPRRIPVVPDDSINLYQFQSLRVPEEEVRGSVSKLLRSALRERNSESISADVGISKSAVKRLARKEVVPTVAQVQKVYSYFALPLPSLGSFVGDRKSKTVTLPSSVTPELAEFMGLFVSEGYIREPCTVVFTNTEESLLERFASLTKEIFGIEPTFERQDGKAPNVLASSAVLSSFLRQTCGSGSRAKKLPAMIMRSSDPSAFAFLQSYYLGDGSFHDESVEFTTASGNLQIGISYLLHRFGILHKLAERTIGSRKYHRIFVYGANAAMLAQGFDSTHDKVAKLKQYSAKAIRHYNSLDVAPLSSEVLRKIYDSAGRPYARLKKEGLEIHNHLSARETMTVESFRKFLNGCSSNSCGEQAQKQLTTLHALSSMLEWVYCDEIASIELLEGPHDVFDFVLPGVENFVGGFGGVVLHNTVNQTDLAKYSDTEMVVYVGCGERGNEMTEVLETFPKLVDPKTGKPLMQRTVLIANTSNMPVAAREASIYTGITIAEYFRDMGYDVAVMADSTSRWAEAMREISGRMEEMPGEEGYPAYLGKKLAEFYERAGRVWCLGSGSHSRSGSVTVVGAVSPPGGDLSEPVSQSTLRVTKVFWALDSALSRRRHYPAINWLKSYSLYLGELREWYEKNVSPEFYELRGQAMALLQKEAELQNIVQLIGPDALPDKERLVLEATKMIREDFLQQNSYDEVDAYSPLRKQYWMLKTVLHFHSKANSALALEVPLAKILESPSRPKIAGLKRTVDKDVEEKCKAIIRELDGEFAK